MKAPVEQSSSPSTRITELPVILSVAFPFAPIGPDAVGGAEVILSSLEAALPALGFRSLVVAHASSQPGGRLYPTPVPSQQITDTLNAEVEDAQQRNIDRALAENPVALVHMHGLDYHRYRIPAHMPVLVTLHLPPAWYPETIWQLPAQYHFVCVSEHQRQACPEPMRARVTVVANGVPLPEAVSLHPEGRYALMMARICVEKNIHTGLEAARLAGLPALLAGEVFPYAAHQRYFAQEIQPRVTGFGTDHAERDGVHGVSLDPKARFLGPVTGAAKARLLARARCLLLPSLAPETSSLVAMEALAAGVPVIAMASGAVPEIVEEGRTGFLIQPGEDAALRMAEAIAKLPQIDRETCRAVAEQRFALPAMLDAYAGLYRTLALPVPSAPTQESISTVPVQAPTVTAPRVVVRRITTDAALTALAAAWADLWTRDTTATPFQHPAWLLPWWRQFGPEGDLQALALYDGDAVSERLLGLLPMYVYPTATAEPEAGARHLLLLGAGTSDYLDGLFDADAAPVELASTALRFAAREVQGWGTLDFVQLRGASSLLAAARGFPPLDALTETGAEPCFFLNTKDELPQKLAANVRRYRRRAEAAGPLTVDVAASPEEALVFFDQLIRLHGERWEARAQTGVLADPRIRAHHREALPALFSAGLLQFFRLSTRSTQNGTLEVLGVLYTLADPPTRPVRSLYLYLVGINTRFAAWSPGTLLFHAMWEHARAEGIAHFDLLRGGEAYKHLWGATPQPTFALQRKRTEDLLPLPRPIS